MFIWLIKHSFFTAAAAAFPLFTRQLWDPRGSIGPRWAGTLLGCVAILLAPSPWIFYRYGPRIRQWSGFAPCIDFKIREQLEAEGESGLRRCRERCRSLTLHVCLCSQVSLLPTAFLVTIASHALGCKSGLGDRSSKQTERLKRALYRDTNKRPWLPEHLSVNA